MIGWCLRVDTRVYHILVCLYLHFDSETFTVYVQSYYCGVCWA